ncbi:MAG: hypothetical protein EOP77_04545 [Variovorax sp.]|nr:MAG: hypothetical protein EOP77_04545 [Variovorax sp.]
MILVKTDAGQQVLKDRSVRLTPRQRSAFILCDGKRSIDEVLAAGMGIGRDDIDQMIELGLLGPMGDATAAIQVAAAAAPIALPAAPIPIGVSPIATPVRLVSESAPPATLVAAVPAALTPAGASRSRQQRYQEAYPIATRLTGGLGLRGFRLNLSVEGTSNYEELLALAPKIRSAVGPDKAADLDRALGV